MDSGNDKSIQLSEKYLGSLYKGAKVSTLIHAGELRRRMTDAEQKLWSLIRNKKLKGKKFRRQHPVGNYILDFYCHECKLAIELDGSSHTQAESREYDEARTAFLKENGIAVLRFWNGEVLNK